MSFDQLGIHLGPLYIRYYGIILMAGAFVAGWIAAREAQRRGHNPDYVWDGLVWVLIGGIVGARIWHIFTPPPSQVAAGLDTAYYLNFTNLVPVFNLGGTEIKLPAALAVGNGGLGIPGAVIGGVLALYWFVRRHKLNFMEWLDIVAPALPIGQAIGRVGNFVNQELYGAPTDLPWGLKIDRPLAPYTPDQRFHPLFAYEAIGNILLFSVIMYLQRRYKDRLRVGDLFLIYLIGYPALRFFLDFIRLDNAQVLGINTNQTILLGVAIAAALTLIARHRQIRRHELKGVPPGQSLKAALTASATEADASADSASPEVETPSKESPAAQ
jgi:phosphatidylglycerol:prolipoprotein diacylglycerol transferase